MKVSSKTKYALKTVLDLAMHNGAGVVPATEIANRQGIPRKFLEQILLALKNGDIVESRRGVKGGYRLKGEPDSINLAAVVRLMGDSLLPAETVVMASDGTDPFAEVWADLSRHIKDKLEATTIQQMRERMDELASKQSPNYVV